MHMKKMLELTNLFQRGLVKAYQKIPRNSLMGRIGIPIKFDIKNDKMGTKDLFEELELFNERVCLKSQNSSINASF